MYNRLAAGHRFSNRRILTEVRNCLKTPLLPSRYSTYQVVFGPNPADRYVRGGDGEDLLFAQDISLSERLVRKRKIRVMAQEAALEEMANRKLRSL